jgi:hypothetical protein
MTLEGGGGGGIVSGITNPISKVLGTSGGGGGILGGLASLDKTVGNTIPGGWGTLATVAASMIPGAQFATGGNLAMLGSKTAAMTGLGALTGSGVLRPGNQFNLQGAMMGGAAAYGMANLAAGLDAAAGSNIPSADIAAANAAADPIAALNSSQVFTGPDAIAANTLAFDPSSTNFAYTPSGEMVPSNISPDITGAVPTVESNVGSKGFFSGVGQQAKDMGRGLANLSGFGADGASAAAQAAFKGAGSTLSNTALPLLAGGTGLMALDEQEKNLSQQEDINKANAADYNTQMARVNAGKARANEAMAANPYQFAMGGPVNYGDDQTGMPNQTPMQRLDNSAMMNYADGGSIPGFAGGRFLSGGGDGLSDDIPAVIGGKQPAKLADGEFVISSDVVSNLGNGSSKAGAKKLYAMMDRVRKQAHGSKKQISKVNAHEVLPA